MSDENKKRQKSITCFFTKKRKIDDVENESSDETLRPTQPEESTGVGVASASSLATTTSASISYMFQERDIGKLLSNQDSSNVLTDEEKYQWLKNAWQPTTDFKFPLVREGKKNRSFQMSWLKGHEWLSYSKIAGGGLCKVCIIFGWREAGTNDVKLGKLVTEPLKTYKKAIETITHHENTKYQQANMVISQNFVMVMEGKSMDVVVQMRSQERKIIEENRKKLIPIIKTVILCGMQNIPLRGHRDDGDLESESSSGEGNFRALLKFRIDAGDEILLDHVNNCAKNASYISKSTQNDLIDSCGELITNKIVNKIKKSKYFTIIADETTDVSISEQLSICIRYFDVVTCEIQEDFLKFVEVVHLTGENIAQHILQALENLNLDITLCRGQAYDGGANMSGKIKGVQACVSNVEPLAFYTHCASHRLNLAISTACTVPSIRNAVGVISTVATFFRESAGRTHLLKEEMQAHLPKEKQNTLKKMCETRWVERHEAVLTFLDILPCLPVILQKMADKGDKRAATAFSLLHAITSSEFLVSLVILADILGITLPLSRSLQATEIDILSAMKLLDTTTASLQTKRETNTDAFKKLFNQVEGLANEIGTEITVRRVTNRQTNRPNIQTQSVEEYYRVSVYIPFLDYLLKEMSSRFPRTQLQRIGQLQKLLSHNFSDEDVDDVLQGAELYKGDLPCFLALKGELQIWQHMRENLPNSPAEAYKRAMALPNIRTLCQLLCTFPVTTSTAERSFSTLRRLKTYLRSRMTEDRLNGLALMQIHQDIASTMNAEEVLDIFSRKHKRKLSLSYM
ncbi:hypothetical protein Zmor_021144 [Zophobas morio]|uniref:Zinc finger MYM-type protein 1 n=2 Tax=Zophobas morio TaxID=2755281 RepID=A0AA38I575_9CUCU|nr:hypothetical protein Zmor_021144 [Zophobas morio]